ncbi:O-antigen ligase family protein [uncultured Dokdonia sp.]|uniref:O-antigen ligase family protein n=1 Tax=uncultured Dokdonia sp. TaxID=575653 RepID=UPI00262E5A7C|nr:O-antigen ligase family protein [uncultured Dokdonia sp.]
METNKSLTGIKIVRIAIGLLFALVVLPSNLKSIAILLFGVAVLINALQRPWHFDKRFFITNALLYVVIAVTYFYSADVDYGQRKLTQMSSLIVFPFVFAMLTKTEGKEIFKNLTTYLWIYVTGVFLFNVISFIWFFSTQYSFPEMMEHFGTVLRVKTGKYSIHPIYLSMHCSIAILFSFYILKELQSKIKIAVVLGMDITLVLFLLLYAKKGPLIALIIVFSLFVVFQRKQKLLKPYLLAVITLIVLTIAIPKTRDRFVELLKIEHLDKGEVTSTNIRYTIYDTAQRLILESPLLGYGIGDYNDALQEKYTQDGNTFLAERKYNAHNQYFSLLLIGGVICLVVFLCFTGINLIYAIRFNNQLLILLLIFYAIVMFTENILEREAGIIFFAFFLNFFSLKSLYLREEN